MGTYEFIIIFLKYFYPKNNIYNFKIFEKYLEYSTLNKLFFDIKVTKKIISGITKALDTLWLNSVFFFAPISINIF